MGTMIQFLAVSQVSNHPPLGENGQLHMNVPPQVHLHKTRNIQYLTVLNCYIFNDNDPFSSRGNRPEMARAKNAPERNHAE